jgi:hypothetical protein
VEAEAEGSMANNLEAKRKHEQRMMYAEDLTSMMVGNKVILSGKQGSELLNFFKETGELVNGKE